MKSANLLLAALAGLAGATPALAAAPAPPVVAPAAASLRQAVQQYHPSSSAPAPRQLTAQERAELRRQLLESRRARQRIPAPKPERR